MAVLTDTKAKNLAPESKPISHGGVTGLSLYPSKTKGHGKWVLRYVSPVNNKRRNMGLGSYPDTGIAVAAALAISIRTQLSNGIDPLETKAAEPRTPKIPSFQSAAETLHTELRTGWKNVKHSQQWLNTLTQYIFPIIGHLALNQIQPRNIADALRPIWLEKPETAGRIKQRMHAVMAWGWANEYSAGNPVDVVTHLLPQQPSKVLRTEHQPAMAWREIPSFLAGLAEPANLGDIARPMLELLILTACRSGEIRGMCWSEINLESAIWTIPANRMKVKLAHRVPLSDRAITILKSRQGLHEQLVFPSPRDQVKPSDMILTSLLRREQAQSDTPSRTATAHGFRSSFRDWCSEHGYTRDLAERALAHTVQNKVEAAYHRTDLLEQRRPMMQAWSDFVVNKKQTQSMAEIVQSIK